MQHPPSAQHRNTAQCTPAHYFGETIVLLLLSVSGKQYCSILSNWCEMWTLCQCSALLCAVAVRSVLVQAAEFMGCKKMTQCLVEWLKGVLDNVLTHNENANLNSLNSEALHHSCPRLWHSTQVLSYCSIILFSTCLLYTSDAADE